MKEPDLKSIASRLAGTPVREMVRAGGGGNSRIYKVITDDRLFTLKEYPTMEHDTRSRLETERRALELMHRHGIGAIPAWIAAEGNFALMTWMEGVVVKQPKAVDIDDAAAFLGRIHLIRQTTGEDEMPLASEACLSGQMIADQLEKRVAALMTYINENPPLMNFLTGTFRPALTKRLVAAKKFSGFTKPLPHAQQTLIAADFGFHNAIRTPDGHLYFIDFEYFGWDDPVKLMCDFLLHPATPLTDAMKKTFYLHMLGIYSEQLEARFAAYYPLFGLRWALILLNEFIPKRWAARQHASGAANWDEVKTAQLAKACAMVEGSETFTV